MPDILKGPCKGKTSFEVVKEMTEYTLAKDAEAKEAEEGITG